MLCSCWVYTLISWDKPAWLLLPEESGRVSATSDPGSGTGVLAQPCFSSGFRELRRFHSSARLERQRIPFPLHFPQCNFLGSQRAAWQEIHHGTSPAGAGKEDPWSLGRETRTRTFIPLSQTLQRASPARPRASHPPDCWRNQGIPPFLPHSKGLRGAPSPPEPIPESPNFLRAAARDPPSHLSAGSVVAVLIFPPCLSSLCLLSELCSRAVLPPHEERESCGGSIEPCHSLIRNPQ